MVRITLDEVAVRRRGSVLLDGVSAQLRDTGVTAIMGANGAGKTTLLRCIHGLERLTGGSISFDRSNEEARKSMALLLQQPVLMRRSVLDNVAYPLRLAGVAKNAARERAREQLEAAGLSAFAERDPTTLSGGERQKMALARALVTVPSCLLLDEPTANLDAESAQAIEAMLARVAQRGTRLVIVTHNAAQAGRLADDILILERGRLVEQRPMPDFVNGPVSAAGRACLAGDF